MINPQNQEFQLKFADLFFGHMERDKVLDIFGRNQLQSNSNLATQGTRRFLENRQLGRPGQFESK